MRRWQLQEAKARFSEVVNSCRDDGPQEITVRGRSAAVVLSKPDYDRMKRRKPSLVAFLRQSPWAGVELAVERDKSRARDVKI